MSTLTPTPPQNRGLVRLVLAFVLGILLTLGTVLGITGTAFADGMPPTDAPAPATTAPFEPLPSDPMSADPLPATPTATVAPPPSETTTAPPAPPAPNGSDANQAPASPTAGDTLTADELTNLTPSVLATRQFWTAQVTVPSASMDQPPIMWTTPPVETGCSAEFLDRNGLAMTAGHCVDPKLVLPVLQQALKPHMPSMVFFTGDPTDPNGSNSPQPDLSQLTPPRLTLDDLDLNVQVQQADGTPNRLIDHWVPAHMVDYQPFGEGDLALLRVPNYDGETTPIPLAATAPRSMDTIYSIGYEGDLRELATEPVTSEQPPKSDTPDYTLHDDNLGDVQLALSVNQGIISPSQTFEHGVTYGHTDAVMKEGTSGGPLVNPQGQLVSINTRGLNGQSSNFFPVHSDLLRYLRAQGINTDQLAAAPATTQPVPTADTQVKPAAQATDDNGPTWLDTILIAFVVGLAVLLIVAIVLLWKLTRRDSRHYGGPYPGDPHRSNQLAPAPAFRQDPVLGTEPDVVGRTGPDDKSNLTATDPHTGPNPGPTPPADTTSPTTTPTGWTGTGWLRRRGGDHTS
jgi:hypothetical protein